MLCQRPAQMRAGHRRAGPASRTPLRAQALLGGFFGGSQAKQAPAKDQATKSQAPKPATFPATYEQAIRQAQEATKAALADGHQLLEVEFPSSSLSAVQGDGEGQNEMNDSMKFARQYLGAFRDQASQTRVFFPDQQELAVARYGQTSDPSAGRAALDPTFEDSGPKFKFGYLTQQNAIWSTLGVNLSFGGPKFSPANQVKPANDKLIVVAYPSFNPREELSAANEIYTRQAQPNNIPMVLFNAELDRLRGGYYPSLFFGELDKLTKTWVPKFEQAYFIHNFKGVRPAALFRCYPGPWLLYRRDPFDADNLKLVWKGDKMPSLKEVALEILPNSNREIKLED